MTEVGDLYQQGEYFVPEILMAAKAFEASMNLLEPLLKQLDSKANGIVIIGVCEGDIHSIGKNLVATMLEAAGFSIIDLGSDVPAEKFIEAAIENEADIIAVSALMTTSMLKMKDVVASLESSGIRAKVMVGGGPVSQEYADKIGAHGYGKDAMTAVRKAIELMDTL
jgi:corrinoid protein of di/trimethylamine methyltransferase